MVGRANGDFDTVNVTTPSSPALLGTLNVGGNVNDISLGNGNQYAFLATSASGKQFQVINISTISSPAVLGTYNYGSTLNGVSYSYVNDRAYAATTNGAQELASFKPS
jgi:hypothetical protein